MRTTRGAFAPTVVLIASLGLILLADLITWQTWRSGYTHPYEYVFEGSLGPLAYGLVGWFIATRVPGNRLGPLMLAIPVVGAVQAVCGNLAVVGSHNGWGPVQLAALAGVFRGAQTCAVGLIIAILFVTPTGRTLSRFYNRCLWILVAATALTAVSDLLLGTTVNELVGGPSGYSLAPDAWMDSLRVIETVGFIGVVGTLLAAMVEIAQRWTTSEGAARRQITWVVVGGLAGPLMIFLPTLAAGLWPDVSIGGSLVWGVAGTMLPLGIAVAVLRHGLYELDRLVSRTVSYGVVSVISLAVYGLIVTGLTSLLPQSDNLAVATGTLAAAALARPILHVVQARVDRRFNREKYDGARAVHNFGTRLRTVVDPSLIVADLTEVVNRTVQPTTTVTWLRRSP